MSKLYYIPLLFTLVSCHIGETYVATDYVSDTEIKKNLKLSDSADNISQTWYEIFNDKDLNTLLKFALNNNFTILKGIERLQQSRYTLKMHNADFLPMIDGTGSYIFSKANSYPNSIENSDNFKVGFDVAWEANIWGRGEYLTERYLQLMQQNQYSLLDIKISVTAEIITNYIQLRTAQKNLEITKHNLLLQNEILQMVKDKYHAGIADDLALNQAEFVAENTKSQIPNLNKQIETYKNALAQLLGVLPSNFPTNLDKFERNIVSNTFKYIVTDLYKLPLNILRNRPDIALSEAQIREQNAVLNTAITELYPSINISGAFAYLSHSGNNLFHSDNQVYGYTPVLSLPIWHWQQLTNNIEVQKHKKSELLLNYNEAMLTALIELKNAIYSIEQAYTINHHKKLSYAKMEKIMNLTREKYKNGLVNFTDIATAEQNLLTAQNDFIESNAKILLYLTAFYKATGGGYNLKDKRYP